MAQKLTAKQKIFVAEYLKTLNATQAAIKAGYAKKTATVIASENLRKPNVSAAIQEAQAQRVEKLVLDGDKYLRQLDRVAMFDARKLFNADGSPKALHELDDETATAVAGLDVVELQEDGFQIGQVKKWKFSDRLAAIAQLLKHLGLAGSDKTEHKFDLSNLSREQLGTLRDILASARSNS